MSFMGRTLHRGFQRGRLAEQAALVLLATLLAVLVISVASGLRSLPL
jgi:hypothetical protein